MRKSFIVVLAVAAVFALAAADAAACGDKYLVAGRGVPDQRALGLYQPASILIYMNPGSSLPSAVKEEDLGEALDRAGHTHSSVDSLDALRRELETGKYQIVLADLADAPSIQEMVESSPAKPVLLPVIHNPSREQIKSAKQEYKNVLQSPARERYLLAVIDRAMTALAESSEKEQ